MESKHTPGPWFVDTSRPKAPYGICQDNEHGWGIAEVKTFALEGTDEGNAKRIVSCVNACEGIADPSAVKDMYEALLLVVRRDGRTRAELESVARAALKKADGR